MKPLASSNGASEAGKPTSPRTSPNLLKVVVYSSLRDSNSVFSWRSFLRENRRRRVPAFSCTYCIKTFSTRQARRNHLSVHQEEVQLRRRQYCFGCSGNPTNNGNSLIPSTDIQPENLSGGTRQNMPLHNLEDSPSSFSRDNSLVNVSNYTANNLGNGDSHLITPSNLSSDGGCTEICHSNYLSMAPATQVSAGTTSLNPPIAFPSDPSSFGGGSRDSLFTAGQGQTSQGPVNPLQNHRYPNLRNKRPYMGDIVEDAQVTNISTMRRQVTGSPQPVQPEEGSKKELLLFKDVSGIVVSSDAEEEVQIDLDLSLHL